MAKVRDTLTNVLAAGFNARAKAAGFRKTGLNFERKFGETTQLIGLQLDKANVGAVGGFFINLGIVLDSLRQPPARLVVAGKPVHFGHRGERFAAGVPAYYTLNEQTDAVQLGVALATELEPALLRFDRIDSAAALLREFPLERGFERELRACIEYALGDYDAAIADLRLLSSQFAERRGMTLEALIARLGMDELILRL